MRRHALHTVLAALAVSVSACATLTPPFARLESAVVDDRYAGSLSRANLRVVRANGVVEPSTNMGILKGDSVITSSTTRVVVTFKAGYEVTLDTNTAIYIENPSIFLRIGQAFIRKLTGRASSEKLDTHTPQVTFTDVGTEFLVSVNGQATDVIVVSGAVSATSRDGQWPGVTYAARQGGRITQGGPLRMQQVSDRQLASQLAWERRVEAVTKVLVPNVGSMTENAARAELQRAGLRESPYVMHRETADFAPGLVIDQSPGAGQTAAPGTYVTLTLAKAKPAPPPTGTTTTTQMCTVPDIAQKSVPEASRLLEGAGLRGRSLTRRAASDWQLALQNPGKNSSVACGSTVTYTLAKPTVNIR